MDFMKVLDQTVREIKREVNLKVLKVPEIEQKVLDATSDEPWGPHGTALSEISRATKKFTECQMVMDVLWTRLTERGPKWRHVYKALTIIEYLIANGSERAVDDILDHSSQILALSRFAYVEPNGKDSGINVRKKAETIMGILNDKERIKAVREKASATRDKYIGLSSTGITYKSSSASYGSSNSTSDRYGSLSGSREADSFSDSYRDKEPVGKDNSTNSSRERKKSNESIASENGGSKLRKGAAYHSRNEDSFASNSLKPPINAGSNEDDFDDFDPRGSSTNGFANARSSEVDLFGPNLMDDFMDATTSATTSNAAEPQADLFADADFQSATPNTETTTGPNDQQENIDLFAGQPTFAAAFPRNTDFFQQSNTEVSSEVSNPSVPKSSAAETFDPFAAIPLNSFEGSDPFGAFASNVESSKVDPTHSSTGNLNSANQNQGGSDFGAFVSQTEAATVDPFSNSSSSNLGKPEQTPLTASKPNTKKDTFQVKSGIWADTLSRGLIDLNITAPKKVNLADIGIVGGLSDGSDEKGKGLPPLLYMSAMGPGSSLGMSGFASSPATGGIENLSDFGQQRFGSFK